MIKSIVALVVATAITTAPVTDKPKPYKDIGEYRISVFCQYCNDPGGKITASGEKLRYGHVAMNNVPFGTKISIDGEVFEVVDRCKYDDTVDIFIENDSGYCQCNTLDYKEVYMEQ